MNEVFLCLITLLWLTPYDLAVICTGILIGISRGSTTVLCFCDDTSLLDLALHDGAIGCHNLNHRFVPILLHLRLTLLCLEFP